MSSHPLPFRLRLATRTLLLSCMLVASAGAAAQGDEIVIIVNPKVGVNKLSRDEVIDIFLGRNRQLPSGIAALPLDLPANMPEKAKFYVRLTGKNLSEINAYWARLIFSGRASPPLQVRTQEEAILMVADNRSAVAYLDKVKAGSQAHVVLELPP